MLRVKRISDVIGKSVYTSDGDHFGEVEEVNLIDNKIEGWRIKIGGGFMNLLGGARGVIVPHQFVKAVGDVFIVNKNSLPVGGAPSDAPMADSMGSFGSAGSDDLI